MKRKPHIALTLLAAAVFCAYLPALSAGYIWDDDITLTNFELLRSFAGLLTIWSDPSQDPVKHYYPLTYTTFWIELRLWGLNPFGYHLVNVLLHLLNTALVWIILQRLEIKGALPAAALFALHPLKVESVAWIAERKDVLSAFFICWPSGFTWTARIAAAARISCR